MAEPTGIHIVEIRAGQSQRPVLELRPSVVVQPMSIGRVGMWSIEAPGVLDVHAYVYFDGRSLFVQSADAANPAKGNGQAIGTQWQQVEIPCTIELGRARLVYRALDEVDEDSAEDKTIAQPIQVPLVPQAPRQPAQAPQFTPNAGMFSNRNRGPDSDATRLQPMTREPDPTVVSPLEVATATPMAGVPKARPAAGMPAWSTTDASPNSSPTTIGSPPQAPAPPPPQNTGYQAFGSVQVAVPPPPPAPMGIAGNPMGQTLNAPMQSPLMQAPPPMMMPMGAPPGYGGQPGMMPYPQAPITGPLPPGASGPMTPIGAMGPGPNAATGRVQAPPSELKGWEKAVAEWKAMPPLRKVIIGTFPGVLILIWMMMFDNPPPRRPRPMPSASVASSTSAPPSATTADTASAPPTATTSAPVVVTTAVPTVTAAPTATTKPPTKKHHKGAKTPERQAMDLIAEGQNAQAAAIYEQLAKDHPEQPAYREAARLLRQRGN